MKEYSGRAADPADDTTLTPFDGSHLAANANPTVWAFAVRWGSTLVVGAPLIGHGAPILAPPDAMSEDEPLGEAA